MSAVVRGRAWLTAALVAAALLFVPFMVWLVLPARPKITIPPIAAATFEAPPPRPTPSFAPPPPRPAPPPAETAKPDEAQVPVRGRVLGPDGAPVARAWVGCTDKDVHTVTDHDGSYELPAEAAGCAAVARRPGFGGSGRVTLKAGDARDNTLQLQAGGRIDGVVVDEQGAPIPKFLLAVEKFVGTDGDTEGSNGRARTVEDASGRFSMENITPGTYVLSASAEGRPPARSDPIEVQPGRTVAGVRIVLAQGAVLSGTVTDATTRAPIEGARVALDSITSTGVGSAGSVRTDEAGKFTLEAVPPSGPFSVRVTRDGYRARVVSGLEVRGSRELTTDIELSPRAEGASEESELGGVGAVLAPQPSAFGALVMSVVPGGPAARAGLMPMDVIVRVDGASTETMTLAECIQRMRGEAGTTVTLTVKRDGQELGFTITRENVIVRR